MLNGIRIAGTGSELPERRMSNRAVAELSGRIDATWIEDNLGIRERRVADPNQCTSDLATKAALEALKNAECDVQDVELLIVATATPDKLAPSTAAIVAERLCLARSVAFDIGAVCSGFLFALVTAAQFVRTGHVRTALVIGADTFSRITDWTARDAGFFGDGAGAVVLQASVSGDSLPNDLRVVGGSQHFHVPAHARHFQMDARAVGRSAAEHLPRSVAATLGSAGLTPDDIDLVVPHQPSIRLLQRVAEGTGIPWERFHLTMDRYANTAAATIPITLHDARLHQRVGRDTTIMFMSAGAGMSVGAAVYCWH